MGKTPGRPAGRDRANAPVANRRWLAIAAFLVILSTSAMAGTALVYTAIGPELREYELNTQDATLSQRNSVSLPANIQAGCVHPSGRYLFIAWSDGTNVTAGSTHGLSVLRIDPTSKGLLSIGQPVPLPSRPIYVSTDPSARHALVAYTNPSGITVHEIASDGTTGPSITQAPLEYGIYGHQILVDPTSTMAILVARGNVAHASRPEDPGALDVFDYRNGLLSNRVAIAPNQGVGFHPRYLEFHPSRPWVFVSLSQQNEIGVYEKHEGDLSRDRLFEKNSLADPDHPHPGQLTGALHIHPSGRFVYLANRAVNAVQVDGKSVFSGGENSIAVFAINQNTGEPTLLQNADTRGIGPVEFAFDPGGKILVVANMMHLWVGTQGSQTSVAASLALFRIREDGRLDFVRKYDIDSDDRTLLWLGVGSLH
jgi:6-phosphogluconolactonase (cycloisomerase 2 family)